MNAPTPYLPDQKTARSTGLPVQVVNLDHPEAPRRKPKGVTNKFGVICVRHTTMTTEGKRRDAHRQASRPQEWCSRCAERQVT